MLSSVSSDLIYNYTIMIIVIVAYNEVALFALLFVRTGFVWTPNVKLLLVGTAKISVSGVYSPRYKPLTQSMRITHTTSVVLCVRILAS